MTLDSSKFVITGSQRLAPNVTGGYVPPSGNACGVQVGIKQRLVMAFTRYLLMMVKKKIALKYNK
jgi:hypothetical protein